MTGQATGLDRELAAMLLEDRTLPAVAHVVALGIVALLVAGALPATVFIPWAAALIAVIAGRAVVWRLLRAHGAPPAVVARAARITIAAQGLTWGVGSAVATHYLPIASVAFLLLALAGLLSGSIATLVADRRILTIYALAMLGPCLIGLAFIADVRVEIVAMLLIIAFAAFTVRLHRRAHDLLRARLALEQELRERERQLASAQAIAHVGSWEWDIATNIVTWSDELRRMYGVPPDAPAGYAEFLALAHPDDRSRLEALVAEGVRTHRTIDYEWRIVRPDGALRHIQGRNVVMTDARGQATHMAGTSLDITERKLAEENRHTLVRELQASVTEVRVLRGILPICANCKRIRAQSGEWEPVESYVRDHTNAEFSHGLCPDCAARDWGGVAS